MTDPKEGITLDHERLPVLGEEVALIEPGLHGPDEYRSRAFELAPGVRFGTVPKWCRDPGVFRDVLDEEALQLLKSAPFCISTEYEFDSAQHAGPSSKGEVVQRAAERIRDASLGLWLARHSSYSVPFIARGEKRDAQSDFLFTGGEKTPRIVIRSGAAAFTKSITTEDLNLAGELVTGILKVSSGSLRLALNFTFKSALEQLYENAYLFQWVALEALFATRSPAEATYRLKQRIALFKASNEDEARDLFKSVEDWYTTRSNLVHGRGVSAIKKKEQERLREHAIGTEKLLRDCLTRIVRDAGLRSVFEGEERDKWLGDLWLRNRKWTGDTK